MVIYMFHPINFNPQWIECRVNLSSIVFSVFSYDFMNISGAVTKEEMFSRSIEYFEKVSISDQ